MDSIKTKYGILKGITRMELYPDGSVKECLLSEYNEIKTRYGNIIPKYEQKDVRDKYTKSISFYKNGKIKSISLQGKHIISTKYGKIGAELITFYEDGSIKRIFPLNGKLTGYWEEEDEYKLAEVFKLDLPFVKFNNKCISITFYNSGNLKSVTLWQNENISVNTPCGSIGTNKGFLMYEDGKLKAVEPIKPTLVTTPIGNIYAYDINAIGIHSDNPSLSFDKDGCVKTLMTSTDSIEIKLKDGSSIVYKPKLIPSMISPETFDTVPVKIKFNGNKVSFNNEEKEYSITDNKFIIYNLVHHPNNKCGNCSSCAGCKSSNLEII